MQQGDDDLKRLFRLISARNDQDAFAELFRKEYKRLYNFSLQYVSTHEAAEEVVNDVFIKLWRYRQSLDTIINPENYLFIAVRNQSLNYIKKYSHLHISFSGEGQLASLVSQQHPEQDMEWKELQFRLNQVISQLPEQCRKIFRLVKEEGLKPRQVAEILNISIRTVETQLYRAMKRLNDTLLSAHPRKKPGKGGTIRSWLLFSFF